MSESKTYEIAKEILGGNGGKNGTTVRVSTGVLIVLFGAAMLWYGSHHFVSKDQYESDQRDTKERLVAIQRNIEHLLERK